MLRWNASIKESSPRTQARRLDSHPRLTNDYAHHPEKGFNTKECVDGELKYVLRIYGRDSVYLLGAYQGLNFDFCPTIF
jgi:hypothetical protein